MGLGPVVGRVAAGRSVKCSRRSCGKRTETGDDIVNQWWRGLTFTLRAKDGGTSYVPGR
jgi:hypothetical protein